MSNVGSSPLRGVKAINLSGVEAGMAETAAPVFEWADPGTLLIDEGYQRNLSERSIKLVRKICARWDWRRFKPPVCARTERGLEVIDGQHTAIAACSHPAVTTIPVMVVEAASRSERAHSFIGHNRDRLNITPMQMHFAAAAAGDEEALTIDQVCARAGVKMLRATPGNGIWSIGDTVAVRAVGALINRRGAMRARIVLEALVKGRAQPLTAGQIKAVETLLHDEESRPIWGSCSTAPEIKGGRFTGSGDGGWTWWGFVRLRSRGRRSTPRLCPCRSRSRSDRRGRAGASVNPRSGPMPSNRDFIRATTAWRW